MYLSEFLQILDHKGISADHPLRGVYQTLFKQYPEEKHYIMTIDDVVSIATAFAEHWQQTKDTASHYFNNPSEASRGFACVAHELVQFDVYVEYCTLYNPDAYAQDPFELLMPGLENARRFDYSFLAFASFADLLYYSISGKDYVFHKDDILDNIIACNRVVTTYDPELPMPEVEFKQLLTRLSFEDKQKLREQLTTTARWCRNLNTRSVLVAWRQLVDIALPRFRKDEPVTELEIRNVIRAILPVLKPFEHADFLVLQKFGGKTLPQVLELFGAALDVVHHHPELDTICFGECMSALAYMFASLLEAVNYLELVPAVAPADLFRLAAVDDGVFSVSSDMDLSA